MINAQMLEIPAGRPLNQPIDYQALAAQKRDECERQGWAPSGGWLADRKCEKQQ